MYTLLIVLIVLVCLLLIGVVLIQNSKGGGLASDFSASNQVIGVQRTGDFLEKATWTLAITLIVLTLGTNFFINRADSAKPSESAIQNQIDQTAGPAMGGTDAGDGGEASDGGEAPVE